MYHINCIPAPSSANMDRALDQSSRGSDRRLSGSGVSGQLPAAQPHRRSDGRHVAHHECRRGDALRSARCTEGEIHRLCLCVVNSTQTH